VSRKLIGFEMRGRGIGRRCRCCPESQRPSRLYRACGSCPRGTWSGRRRCHWVCCASNDDAQKTCLSTPLNFRAALFSKPVHFRPAPER
jgi:hypothetical protein